MTKDKTTDITTPPTNAVEELTPEISKKLNELGNATKAIRPFIPIIRVNNKTNNQGETPKSFLVTKKDDNGNFVTEPFVQTFRMVPFMVRYRVEKKYNPKDKSSPWRSIEFNSFRASDIRLVHNKQVFDTLSYYDFKNKYEGAYTLYMILYIIYNKEVYKLEAKGTSRQMLWEYITNNSTPQDSAFSWVVEASVQEITEGVKHNALVLKKTDERADWKMVMEKQKELRNIIGEMENEFEQVNDSSNITDKHADTNIPFIS